MYNENQKQAYVDFIEEYVSESTIAILQSIFKRSAEYELKFSCDLAEMSQEAVSETISNVIKNKSTYDMKRYKSLCRNYVQWCIDYEKTPLRINHIYENDDLYASAAYSESMLKDEVDLIFVMNQIFRPELSRTVDNMYRCCCFLLFAGLTENEVFALKKDQIDFEARKIHLDRRDVAMSPNLYGTLSNYMSMTHYETMGVSKSRKTKIIKTDYLLENTVSIDKKSTPEYRVKMTGQFKNSLTKANRNSKKISPKTILFSGIFWRMYQDEQYNILDTSEYQSVYQKDKNRVKYLEAKCLGEYGMWKRTFYP